MKKIIITKEFKNTKEKTKVNYTKEKKLITKEKRKVGVGLDRP